MPDQIDRAALLSRLRRAVGELVALAPAVDAGAPWPLSDSFGIEPEAHWGPPEVLAHLAEMTPYWTGEIERVLDGPDDPVPFGRVASNELRVAIIERDRSLPARELLSRIESDAERLARRLEALDERLTSRRGLHPTRGTLTVAQIADTFVVSHLEEHVVQLREVLAAR
jgi:hypothetical protein